MIKRILTICAAVAAGAAGTSLALAAGLSGSPPGAVYSTAPQPYPPGGYPADYRRGPGTPDFDALDDDEAPNAQSSTALPPPGPVLSPDDPRYGRPPVRRRFIPTAACRPVRSFRPTIRAMAVPPVLRRSIPTAPRRPVRSFRPTIPVMAVPTDRRR